LTILLKRWHAGATNLPVQAFDQERQGYYGPAAKLLALTNSRSILQTGTVKLKAIFDNKITKLFPNQFVTCLAESDTLHDATVMSSAAVQRGSMALLLMWSRMTKVTVRMLKLGPGLKAIMSVMEAWCLENRW